MSDDQMIKIAYGEASGITGSFQRSRTSTLSFTDVVWRIREAIQAADLWVLHEIDSQMLMRRGGYLIGAARQIYFFHPRRMERILRANPAALLEAPLKIAIIEMPEGSVDICWNDPAGAFALYQDAQLTELGLELSASCAQIAAAGVRRNVV